MEARAEGAHPSTFTNVEVSECTFFMKVSLMKKLGKHKDKKAILVLIVLVPCCDK